MFHTNTGTQSIEVFGGTPLVSFVTRMEIMYP